jgi:ABC-2 type transport system permease protein
MTVVYLRYELLRAVRNRRFLLFALVFPLVLYFVIAAPNKDAKDFGDGSVSVPLYYMVSLASFGTMTAMLSTGGRIAGERSVGWNRQLRISPLSVRAYFTTKVLTAYILCGATIALLYLSGLTLGVSLPATDWLAMTALILIGLIPFAALGVLIGHLLTPDSIGPAIGGGGSLLAIISGTWFPIGTHGAVYEIARLLPSYWLVQASHVSLGGEAWTTLGWAVIAFWSVVLSLAAARAYRRDTERGYV